MTLMVAETEATCKQVLQPIEITGIAKISRNMLASAKKGAYCLHIETEGHMGCDVHIHAEVKINGRWQHYDQPNCDRNYLLFEKMAGVRGEVKNAIAAPRGLPDDATEMTRFDSDHWNGDGHSHSWLTADEILLLAEWYAAEYPRDLWPKFDQWLFGNSYSSFVKYPEDRPKGIEDVRFIFWFDN